MMNNTTTLLNWNIRGFFTNKYELQVLINEFKPLFITLQETKLNIEAHINNYKSYIKNKPFSQGINACGGVMTLVNSNLHSLNFQLNTNLQAIAVKLYYPFEFIICNLYVDHNISSQIFKDELESLISQLGHSFILTGDFNSHNILWGSHKTDRRGNIIKEITESHSLTILNEKLPTHIATNGRLTSIDLTICTQNLVSFTDWTVLDDLHGSDHFPLLISFPFAQHTQTNRLTYNIKKADWNKFKRHLNFENINTTNINNMEKDFTERIIQAANKSIPVIKPFRGKRKLPFWNDDIKGKIIERKKNIRLYKNTLNPQNRNKITELTREIRQLITKAKTESWRQYTSTINHKVSTKEVYDKVRTLSGKSKNTEIKSINKIDGTSTTNQTEIANTIKNTFEYIYSNNNMNTNLSNLKQQSITNEIFPEDTNNEPYNDNITMKELEDAIEQTNGSSPGPDRIHYDMLKNLTHEGKCVLLELYNKALNDELPQNWKHSLIIPIKKPGKDQRQATSYRPIALTSCTCKLMEKIINRRIQWTLENKNLLNNNQSGFTKGKSTTDNITFLVDSIQKGFAEQQQTTAIFIDLKNAYDRVWTHKVTDHMIRLGFKGRIIKYIHSFLQNRTFNIQLGNIKSDVGFMENGIPQGSVLSCTLFNIVFDDVLNHIDTQTQCCAYADDLVIFKTGKDTKSTETTLQRILNETNLQMNRNGLEISLNKTKIIHFSNQRKNNIQKPRIQLDGQDIEHVNSYKFLGVVFNNKLKWTDQINELHSKTTKNVNLIKMLSHTKYGGERETLLRIHEAITTSIHNYSAQIFTKLTKKDDRKLNTIHTRCTKYAIGAFVTSPNTSVHSESGIIPLKYQRKVQLIKYACKIKKNKNNILHSSLEDNTKDHKYQQSANPPITYIMRQELQKLNINNDTKLCTARKATNPFWRKSNFKINLTMTQYNKETTSHETIKRKFNETLSTYAQKGFEVIYTDGSKTEHGYGAAVVTKDRVHKYKCHEYSSVYSTELFALLKAIKHRSSNKTLICTDSLSAVNALKNLHPNNNMVQQIQDKLREPNTQTIIMWIPSHTGIIGNEKADINAKEATKQNHYSNYEITTEDITKHIKDYVMKLWQMEWDKEIGTGNKLGNIKKTINKWTNINFYNRKDQTVLTRLRIGHTNLTHIHLIERNPPPTCTCNQSLTVKHIFECTSNQTAIAKHNINYLSLSSEDKNITDKILEFVKEINLYDKI